MKRPLLRPKEPFVYGIRKAHRHHCLVPTALSVLSMDGGRKTSICRDDLDHLDRATIGSSNGDSLDDRIHLKDRSMENRPLLLAVFTVELRFLLTYTDL